jgi:hypothetical protein
MKTEDWETDYGESVRIINEQIIAAFRPKQIKAATEEAARLRQAPVIIAKGVLV